MKIINFFLVIFILSIVSESNSQNCSNTSVGFTPLNDLGAGFYRGLQGGLYPGGENFRPSQHDADGIDLALQVVPLDTAGNYDPVTGRIVLLSVGMSNCSQEFQRFRILVNGAAYLNPKLSIINGAQGGQTIDIIINPNAAFWTVIEDRLRAGGLSVKQVQAVWFKEAQASPTDTSFPGYPSGLKEKFKTAMTVMKAKFINLKLCYNASRIYGGYASTGLNPEPYSYYSGWSVKWLIEDQITGDTSLIYKGINPKSAWLSWGPYLWADGIIPRSDGLTWNCPADFNADGTHPSVNGTVKVAEMLDNFFRSDASSKPWFLKSITLNLKLAEEGFYNPVENKLRMKDTVKVYLLNSTSPYATIDSSKAVIDSSTLTGTFKFYNAPPGIYYIKINHRNSIETWSKSGGVNFVSGNIYNYDLTDSSAMAYGNNMIFNVNKYCIYSGDVNQDGAIDLADGSLIDNDAFNFASGYLPTDTNGDGIIDVADAVYADNNGFNFVSKITP